MFTAKIRRIRSGSTYVYSFQCEMCVKHVEGHPDAEYVRTLVREHLLVEHKVERENINVLIVNPPKCDEVLQFGFIQLGCSMGEHRGDHEQLYEDVGVNGKKLAPGQKVKVRWSVVGEPEIDPNVRLTTGALAAAITDWVDTNPDAEHVPMRLRPDNYVLGYLPNSKRSFNVSPSGHITKGKYYGNA